MEVRQQPYRSRKSIARYFWEFFILLLAVVLGFFIENQRKNYVDGKNEKRWAGSLIQDLKSDISEMDKNIRLRSARFSQLDSIIIILREKKIFGHENDLYFLGKMATRAIAFYPNDAHLENLENQGVARLNKSTNAHDTIRTYTKAMKIFLADQSQESEQAKSLFPLLAKIFDPFVFEKIETPDGAIIRPNNNPFLKNADPEVLNELAFYIQDYKSGIKNRIGQLRKLQVKAKRVIAFLENEYKQ